MRPLEHSVELKTIVDALGGELQGNPATPLTIIASLENASQGSITFLANPKYDAALFETQASAVILPHAYAARYAGNAIYTDDPYLYFAQLTQWWKLQMQKQLNMQSEVNISPAANVHASAKIAQSAKVAAGAVIDANACIGENTSIGAGTYIGANVCIGDDCRIAANVTVLNDCTLGNRCIINSGAVIGGDGFGFAPSTSTVRRWNKIEQLGTVKIGNDVEIGSNTCIDRGAIDDTIIGDGVKLDNVIQIGHNVHIGDDSLMASCTGISGSTHIGKRCIIGGAVGMAGHIEVVDDVTVMAATNVTKSIAKPGVYSGIIPFDEAGSWRKNAALLRHLSSMRDRIRALEAKILQLNKDKS